MADADARWLSPESRAGPNRGAVVSGSGSGSGSSSAQRAATTAVHLGAGAACIWILLAYNEHHARLIGCRSRTAGQGGTWCIVRNDHGPESRREATSTSPSSSPDAANACLSCLPLARPLTESSARHREDQHTHAAASGRPVRNATQRSQRARACRRTLRSGGGQGWFSYYRPTGRLPIILTATQVVQWCGGCGVGGESRTPPPPPSRAWSRDSSLAQGRITALMTSRSA